MIHTKDLTYQYAGGKALSYPDVDVRRGETLLIIGHSGCGKTTLLHLLGGLLRPTNGQVVIHNQNTSILSDKKLDTFRGQHIGFVFQKAHFVQSLTVKDNILLASYLSGKQYRQNDLNSLTEKLGITTLLGKMPSSLSQGEQQRVSIARAILHQPDLVLADEPTSSLDDENTAKVASLLLNLTMVFGVALIIVTHDERLKTLIPQQLHLS